MQLDSWINFRRPNNELVNNLKRPQRHLMHSVLSHQEKWIGVLSYKNFIAKKNSIQKQ